MPKTNPIEHDLAQRIAETVTRLTGIPTKATIAERPSDGTSLVEVVSAEDRSACYAGLVKADIQAVAGLTGKAYSEAVAVLMDGAVRRLTANRAGAVFCAWVDAMGGKARNDCS